jgi:SPP1 family predicted phage head-tail adaptor
MDAGKFRQRITIQSRSTTQDSETGEILVTWTNLHYRIPASVEPLSVKEFLQSQAEQTQVTARMTIRYRPGLDSSMRILYRDKIYNPAGFLADKNSGIEYLTIPVTEGVGDGT